MILEGFSKHPTMKLDVKGKITFASSVRKITTAFKINKNPTKDIKVTFIFELSNDCNKK
jgi:hypothetical protein